MSWNWRTPSLWQRLVVALLIVAAASVLRAMFFGGLGRNTPYLLYFPAVTLAALFGGLAAGVLATALSAALTFFWIQRGYLSPVEPLALAVFFSTCTLISWLCEMLLRARSRAKLAQERTEVANQELRSEVAERKRAEAALRETNEYLDNLFNYANAPIIVWNPQFKITRFNHAFESLTGRRSDEVVGKSLELLFPPAMAEDSMALIKKTTGGKRWETVEISILHLDGAVRTVLWNSATVFAVDGTTPVAAIAQGQDITERKRAEEALRQSEEFNRRVIESSHDCIKVLDLDANLLSMSEGGQRLLGITDIAPYLNRSWVEFWQEIDRPRVREAVAAACAGNVGRFQAFCPAVTGEPRWWDVIVTPIYDAVGQPRQLLAVSRDITERKQAEEALRASEERFRIAAETANDVVYEWDLKQQVQWLGKIDEMLGYEPGEFPRTLDGWAASLHPEDVEPTMAAIQTHLEGRAPYAAEYRVRRKDGVYRWWAARGAAARTPNGKTSRWIGSITDITERKRAEEALRESESRFRQLAESLPQLVWTCLPDGPCDYLSRQWLEFTGVPEAQQLGFGWLEQLHPDDRAPTIAAWEAAVASGADFRAEFRIRRQDGEYRWFDTQAVRLRDATGRTVKWFGSNTDITERKQAAAALLAEKQRLEMASVAGNVALWDWDIGSGVLEWSSAIDPMLGFGKEKFPRTIEAWGKALHPDDAVRVAGALDRHQRGEAPYEIDYRVRRADGSYLWWHVVGVAERDAAGKAARMAGSCTDITERKRTEERLQRTLADLERSNKELEQFAYVASHDLQEPLRMISSYTQLLAQRYDSQLDDKARKYIRYAVDGAIRMQTLINDLLTYSRAGTRGKTLEMADSHAVLGEAIRNLATAINESRAIISNDDLPMVRADATQLVLVFQNLLSNAIKFRREGNPRIHVSASDQGSEWVFSVKDNGIGIEPQHADRVFVIFQRLHTREEYPGTGIGLAVCKRIVERHHGRIWFESTPGDGATFFFTLPK